MQKRKPGTVRIIGGRWRGRRLPVPDIEGLRPSGDRSRETLFNWLQPHLARAACLDLFAGTGVLGLEAVSRGAVSAVLVEKSPAAVAAMRQSVAALGADRVSVVQGEALSWLRGQAGQSVDLVLVDPPFALGLAQSALLALEQADVVRPGGLVYLESARSEAAPQAGPNWQILKEQTMGEVRMQLFRKVPLES
jgi:16S rRNA (guanine966-N2)-methyltransferase